MDHQKIAQLCHEYATKGTGAEEIARLTNLPLQTVLKALQSGRTIEVGTSGIWG